MCEMRHMFTIGIPKFSRASVEPNFVDPYKLILKHTTKAQFLM